MSAWADQVENEVRVVRLRACSLPYQFSFLSLEGRILELILLAYSSRLLIDIIWCSSRALAQ